ncbi:MAG: TetR/AcrR family transcriptional regulator, partial [Actinomycetota bacterium]
MFYTVTSLGVNMSTEPELPRALALAWGVAAAPQRGPKREMSIERIVEAAIAIADESGLGAVSMSAVAARFDMTPMALYRYVSAKDDLVTLMFEYGTGLPPAIDPEAPWRASVELWARAQLARFLAHPWLLDIPIEGAPLTPNGLAWA